MKTFIGKQPHPKMQTEFMEEPTTAKGKAEAQKLIAKLKEKK